MSGLVVARNCCMARMIKGMWTDNTSNAKIKGGSNRSVEDIKWL